MLVIEKRYSGIKYACPESIQLQKDPASSYSSLQKSCPNSRPSVVFATFCNDDLFQEYALFVPQDAHEKAEQTKTNQPTRKKTQQNTNLGLLIHHVDWVSNLGKLWSFQGFESSPVGTLNSGISHWAMIFLVVMIKWLRYSKNSKHPMAWSQVLWHGDCWPHDLEDRLEAQWHLLLWSPMGRRNLLHLCDEIPCSTKVYRVCASFHDCCNEGISLITSSHVQDVILFVTHSNLLPHRFAYNRSYTV